MTDSNPSQQALFDVPAEDPLPPDPVPVEIHVAIDLRFRCDLAAFAAANVDSLTDYAFLARLNREGFEQIERLDVLLHDQIEEALDVALCPIAGVDPRFVVTDWEGRTRIDEATAHRAEEAMTPRYPSHWVGDSPASG